MLLRRNIFVLACCMLCNVVMFSADVIRCSTVEVFRRNAVNNPAVLERKQSLEGTIQDWIAQKQVQRGTEEVEAVITIPVVIHVVYNTSAQNISDAQILSQIDRLNRDYRNINTDRLASNHAFYSLAADAGIEFCLAKIDPNGNATTGITRTSTSKTSFTDDDYVKSTSKGGKDGWDPQKYLNIWVCNLSGDLLGYAQFPSDLESDPKTDGVVIGYKYFGTIGTVRSPFDQGRTAVHEIGHWLNLEHIWGDDEDCSGTDNVADTPDQEVETSNCPSGVVTDNCTIKSPGIMYQNYMDYTDDACMVMFTAGQVARMKAVLNTTRIGLLTSNRCSGTTSVTQQQLEKLKIYPNPVQNYLVIEGLPSTRTRTFTADFYNVLGEKVFTIQLAGAQNMIEMADLATGTYILHVYNEEFSATQKLSVLK